MDQLEAITQVRQLMDHHGLSDWQLRLDHAVRRFGYCSSQRKLISLSKHLIGLNHWDHVKDTALHEIAHALAGPKSGHGRHWKAMAKQIGCSAERCWDQKQILTPPAKFKGTCPNCKNTIFRNHRRNLACSICCRALAGGRYDAHFSFAWENNGL